VRRRDLLLAIGSVALGCGRRSSEPERARSVHRPPPANLPIDGEPPQSYADFVAEQPARPSSANRTIAILPIGEYPRGFIVEYERTHLVRSPEPALLGRVCEAWFGLPVTILPAMADELLEPMPARERDGRRQLDAEALLTTLRLPSDCFCMLALTLEDLYQPGEAWVFGLASIPDRVAVHSMLRYDPGFANADARPPDFEHTILTRALRVVVHELGHLFGLRHCVHFACIMNPTAGLADLDALPLDLCPVCLRKLWTATGLSLETRWRSLAELAQTLELDHEATWYRERLAD
jgi:archaemetzincin